LLNWPEIRKQYPNKIVLVEARSVYLKGNKRVIEEMCVLENYENSREAWSGYKKFRFKLSGRELYLFHTSNAQINVDILFVKNYTKIKTQN